jgi:hypothetical protein
MHLAFRHGDCSYFVVMNRLSIMKETTYPYHTIDNAASGHQDGLIALYRQKHGHSSIEDFKEALDRFYFFERRISIVIILSAVMIMVLAIWTLLRLPYPLSLLRNDWFSRLSPFLIIVAIFLILIEVCHRRMVLSWTRKFLDFYNHFVDCFGGEEWFRDLTEENVLRRNINATLLRMTWEWVFLINPTCKDKDHQRKKIITTFKLAKSIKVTMGEIGWYVEVVGKYKNSDPDHRPDFYKMTDDLKFGEK